MGSGSGVRCTRLASQDPASGQTPEVSPQPCEVVVALDVSRHQVGVSVRHVEVFQMGSVRTSIIGRPRRLPRDRRAALRYTVNYEEPPKDRPAPRKTSTRPPLPKSSRTRRTNSTLLGSSYQGLMPASLPVKEQAVQAPRSPGCRPPAGWDHFEVSFATGMGPPVASDGTTWWGPWTSPIRQEPPGRPRPRAWS